MPRYLFPLIGMSLVAACGDALVGGESDCAPVNHCHFEDGVATCDEGYTWEDADDQENLVCVLEALPPAAPTIAAFTATPSSVVMGTPTSVEWTWTYANSPSPALTCFIDNGVGPATNGAATSVTLSSSTVFALTCTNAGGSDTAQTTVDVVAAPVAPSLASFTSTPASVTAAAATSVTWSWTYANSPTPMPTCTIDPSVGTVANGGATTMTLSATTTLTLTCSNVGGSDTAQTTVGVVAAPVAPSIATFTAAPASVTIGVPTNVVWSWTYANSPTPAPTCTVDQGVGAVTNGAATSVLISAATSYTLTCTNTAGGDAAQTEP